MMILVTYDVSVTTLGGKRRWRNIMKECCNFGQRVQYSVFECIVDPLQFEDLKHRLLKIMNKDSDSIRFYFLFLETRIDIGLNIMV
jgi:CRISPR-associated protein Cas2